MLQCAAMCCTVLQGVAVYYRELRRLCCFETCSYVCCSVLYGVALCCSVQLVAASAVPKRAKSSINGSHLQSTLF